MPQSKLLLRTHTTASSASILWKLAARCRGEKDDPDVEALAAHTGTTRSSKDTGDGFRPAKLFSIDRVFRNETMDATHLAEFHQVEGVVADRDLTLADLIGQYNFVPNRRQNHLQLVARFHESILQENGY